MPGATAARRAVGDAGLPEAPRRGVEGEGRAGRRAKGEERAVRRDHPDRPAPLRSPQQRLLEGGAASVLQRHHDHDPLLRVAGLCTRIDRHEAAFGDEFRRHLGASCPLPRQLPFHKLVDWDATAGRFSYDLAYAQKQPDWSYR